MTQSKPQELPQQEMTPEQIYDQWTVKVAPKATAFYNGLAATGALSKDPLFFIKRSMTVGGSDIGTLLNLNKYQSPVDLFARKTMRVAPDAGSFDTRLGTHVEPFIYEELPHVIKGAKLLGPTDRVDVHHAWRTAQIDNTAYIPQWDMVVNIECKKFQPSKDWGKGSIITDAGEIAVDGEDDLVPASYYAQCVWGQAVGLCENKDNPRVTLLLAWAPFEHNIRVYVIRFDRNLAISMFRAADAFVFYHLIPDVYPSRTTHEEVEMKKSVSPKANKDNVWADSTLLIAERAHLLKVRNEAQERIDQIDDTIKLHCGDYEAVYDSNNCCIATWKKSKRTSLDTKKLKAEKPEVYEEYARTTETRIFKVM